MCSRSLCLFLISSNSSHLTGVCMLALVKVYWLDVKLDYMPPYYMFKFNCTPILSFLSQCVSLRVTILSPKRVVHIYKGNECEVLKSCS